jgi:hypothetical protein
LIGIDFKTTRAMKELNLVVSAIEEIDDAVEVVLAPNDTLKRLESESNAVSVQVRQERIAAGECYRPHGERGGRGGIFGAVVDKNAILRGEPFDFEQFEERGGIGFHETQFMRQIGGVDMVEYLVICLDMRHMRCIRVGKQDDAMELSERVNHRLHAGFLAEMAAP